MKKIDLQEADLQTLQRCLNAGEEPPPELAKFKPASVDPRPRPRKK